MNKKIFAILAVCTMVMTACGPAAEESAQLPETSEKTTTAEAEITTADAETTTAEAETTTAVDSAVENAAGGNNNSAETTAAVQATEKADPNKMAELSSEPPVYTKYLTSENSKMPALPENYEAFPEINTDLSLFEIPDNLDYEYQSIAYHYTGTKCNGFILSLYNSHGDDVFNADYSIGGDYEGWTAPFYTDYEYDAKGNPTVISYYNADGILQEEIYTYDANGNVTYSESYDGLSGTSFHTTNTYDQKGNVLVSEGINALDGEFKNTYTYEYDANGNAVYGKVNATKNPWSFNEFRQRFDDRGNMIEFVGKCDKAADTHRELAYDSNNNCIYEKNYYSGDVENATITEYLYDENNNCLCKMINSPNYTYADYYEYDAKGRPTKHYNQSSDSEDSFTLYVYEELS